MLGDSTLRRARGKPISTGGLLALHREEGQRCRCLMHGTSQPHANRADLEGRKLPPEPKNADAKRARHRLACDGKLLVLETLTNGTKERPLLGGDPRAHLQQLPPGMHDILGNRFDNKVVGIQVGVPQMSPISLLSTLTSNGAISVLVGGNRGSKYSVQARFESPGVVIYLALTRQLGLEAQIGAPMKRKVRHAAHPFSVQAAIGLRVRCDATYDLFAAGSSRRDVVPGDADDRWLLPMLAYWEPKRRCCYA
jgi:hypothetical protein